MKSLILIGALGIAANSLAIPASARPTWTTEATVTETIQYGDLDLTSPKDRARLEQRIRSAAYRMCLTVDSASPAPPPTDPTCFIETMKDATVQVGRAVARANRGPAIASAVAPATPK